MNKRQRVITGAVGLAAMAGVGLLGATVAQAGGSSSGSDEDPALNSSVSAPAEQENGPEVSEADESAALEGLATVTPDEAEAAALAAVPGTAAQPELENENGSVVYEVEVTQADGTVVEVKVDAGNGDVLAQEDESDEANEVDEGPEGSEDEDGPEGADD